MSTSSGGEATVPAGGPSSSELAAGLAHTHDRANANTAEVHRANATAGALAELLVERGVLAREEVEERRQMIGDGLREEYLGRGMGVALQETETSKYEVEEAPKIDCAARLPLCKGACCRLSFALTAEDVEEGVVRWNLRRPYVVARGANGRCVHQEEGSCRCSVYEHRPQTCRTYDCRKDGRIWLDFERRIPNPALEDPDWPRAEPAAPDPARGPDSPEVEQPSQPSQTSQTSQPPSLEPMIVSADPRRPERFPQRVLDRLIRPRIRVFGRPRAAYGVFVCLGGLMGIALALLLAAVTGLSTGELALVLSLAAGSAYLLGLVSRSLLGFERYTFFHYEIAVLLASGAALRLLDRELIPHLALVALAMATCQAVGRLGCFVAGCCHGPAGRWGVCYGSEHVAMGLPPALAGTRLFPVQLLESAGLSIAVAVLGAGLVAGRLTPAGVLAHLLMLQAAIRSVLELQRADPRPRFLGVSEGQWTAAAIAVAVLGLAAGGWLPMSALMVALALLIGSTWVFAGWRSGRRHRDPLAMPEARTELAALTLELAHRIPPLGQMRTGETGNGLRLSVVRVPEPGRELLDLAFSSESFRLTARAARRVGERILAGWPTPLEAVEVIASERGVHHLLLAPGSPAEPLE